MGNGRNGRLTDLTGKTYGRLTAISSAGKIGNYYKWDCLCSCGRAVTVRTASLNNGTTKSCGCLGKEKLSLRTKHNEGKTGGRSQEYSSWFHMNARCDNPKHRHFKHYGGRGINVCDRWRSYSVFLEDMGRAPSAEHTLDRIDVNGNYEPSNCRWADRDQQHNNKRDTVFFEHNGEIKSRMQWARYFGVPYDTMRKRTDKANNGFRLVSKGPYLTRS